MRIRGCARRNKPSKFDPYLEEVTSYVDAGMKISEITEILQQYFDDDFLSESGLYEFVRSRGLKSKVTQGGTNLNYEIPLCEGCQNCVPVLNTNDREVLLCMAAKRIINRSCMTSPMWCHKRGELIKPSHVESRR